MQKNVSRAKKRGKGRFPNAESKKYVQLILSPLPCISIRLNHREAKLFNQKRTNGEFLSDDDVKGESL